MESGTGEYRWVFHVAIVLAIMSIVFMALSGAVYMYTGLKYESNFTSFGSISMFDIAYYLGIVGEATFGTIFPLLMIGFRHEDTGMVKKMPSSHLTAGCILMFVGVLYGGIAYAVARKFVAFDIGMYYTIYFFTITAGWILVDVGVLVLLAGMLRNLPAQRYGPYMPEF